MRVPASDLELPTRRAVGLERLADRCAVMPDGVAKLAMVQRATGTRASFLIPLLNLGGEVLMRLVKRERRRRTMRRRKRRGWR